MLSALGLVATGFAGAANDREESMPVVDPRIAGKPVPRISKETMERERVARVKNVKALDVAFLDQRIPRYERDIINMVGMGVTDRQNILRAARVGPKLAACTCHSPIHGTPAAVAFEWMTKEFNERAKGGLAIEFHGGTLIPKELEIMNAVKTGNIAIGGPA